MIRNVVNSVDVSQYKLTKKLRDKLAQVDALMEYNRLAGRPALTVVRLYTDDYRAMARAIQDESNQQKTIRDVRYRGLPLVDQNITEKEIDEWFGEWGKYLRGEGPEPSNPF